MGSAVDIVCASHDRARGPTLECQITTRAQQSLRRVPGEDNDARKLTGRHGRTVADCRYCSACVPGTDHRSRHNPRSRCTSCCCDATHAHEMPRMPCRAPPSNCLMRTMRPTHGHAISMRCLTWGAAFRATGPWDGTYQRSLFNPELLHADFCGVAGASVMACAGVGVRVGAGVGKGAGATAPKSIFVNPVTRVSLARWQSTTTHCACQHATRCMAPCRAARNATIEYVLCC